MTKSDPTQIQNTSTDLTKLETGDYVRETTHCAKFCANPSTEGFSANG